MSNVEAVHFWSPTCGPCKVIKPALDDIKEEFPQVTWTSVNTKDDPNGYARRLGVQVVPTIVFFCNGKEVGRHSGANVGIYYTLIRKALNACGASSQ
jgi:thioredoxin-like negative regulator of GroEL